MLLPGLLIRRQLVSRPLQQWRACSAPPPAPSPARLGKRQLVVNAKYLPSTSSNPLYEDLLYSTEVEVYLTAKRGKAWLEMKAAKQYRAQNEQRERERSALARPPPVALQFLFGGAQQVQTEDTATQNEHIDVVEEVAGFLDAGIPPDTTPVLPYTVYSEVKFHSDENVKCEQISNVTERTVGSSEIESRERGTGRRARGGRRERGRRPGDEGLTLEAAERTEFERISDASHSEEIRQAFTEDHLFKFGTADPDMPGAESGQPCGGCGAHLHCTDEKIPGFVPSQILAGRVGPKLRATLCQRCYIIKEYNVALKVTVSPEDYPRTIQHIKHEKALVLLVVDLLDFPNSIWPGILELLGKNKKIILVGNKFDLVVPDSENYCRTITRLVREEVVRKCYEQQAEGSVFPQIVGACCVSATTGFNIESLVDQIFKYWKTQNDTLPGDIYIVGCTNVGKSSLFNMLLDSDLCKAAALDRVTKAVVSPVPGTTLNLLKFPLSRPEPHFIANRRRRVAEAEADYRGLEAARLAALAKTRDPQLALPGHFAIKHTLGAVVRREGGYQHGVELEVGESQEVLDPGERQWGKHCHDTPGTVSRDQLLDLLTAEEVGRVVADSPLQPRTLLLRPGHTLLLGGLARLDLLSSARQEHPVRVTVFCSARLPLNIVRTAGAGRLLARAGTELLGVAARPELPALQGRQLEVQGVWGSGRGLQTGGGWRGAADIVLSSCGWVMVSPREGETAVFLASTPGGRGIGQRPPFLPNSVNLRGKRIAGTPAFRSDFVFLSNNV